MARKNKASVASTSNESEHSQCLSRLKQVFNIRWADSKLASVRNIPYVEQECELEDVAEGRYVHSQDSACSIQSFIDNSKYKTRSLVIAGDLGIGKSTALARVECSLWESLDFDKIGLKPQLFPLMFELRRFSNSSLHDVCLKKATLSCLGGGTLSLDDLDVLEKTFKLTPIWLFDGYEEMKDSDNTNFEAELFKCDISIITCTTDCYENFSKTFQARKGKGRAKRLFEAIHLLPFKSSQVDKYLEMRIQSLKAESKEESVSFEVLKETICEFPCLENLLSVPFALELISEEMIAFIEANKELKQILTSCEDASLFRMTACRSHQSIGLQIISNLIKATIQRKMKKLCTINNEKGEIAAHERADFISKSEKICEELAFVIQHQNAESDSIDLSEASKRRIMSHAKLTNEQELDFVLDISPLKKSQEVSPTYSFCHRFLWEYFLARRSMHSPRETLGVSLFVQDRGLLSMHAEFLTHNEGAQKSFIDLVLSSRMKMKDPGEDRALTIAASNALSILNYGAANEIIKFNFKDIYDWRGIRVPRVNLNQARIFGCDFEGSDLSGASLIKTLVISCNLKDANLRGAIAEEQMVIYGHNKGVMCVAISPDGRFIASGGDDNALRVWDTKTGACTFAAQLSKVVCVFDSRRVLFTHDDMKFLLWDNEAYLYTREFDNGDEIGLLFEFSPDGEIFAIASTDKIRMWNSQSSRHFLEISSPSTVKSLHINPTLQSIATLTEDNMIRLWDLNTGQCIWEMEKRHSQAFCFHPSGRAFAIGSAKKDIMELYDAATLNQYAALRGHPGVIKISFSPNGDRLYSLSKREKNVKIWNLPSQRCIKTFGDKSIEPISDMAVSHNGLTLATICKKGRKRMNFWDTKTFECVGTFKGADFNGRIESMRYSLDNQHILLKEGDRKFLFVSVVNGKRYCSFGSRGWFGLSRIVNVGFNHDGSQLASVDIASGVRKWDASLWQINTSPKCTRQKYRPNTAAWRTIAECNYAEQLADKERLYPWAWATPCILSPCEDIVAYHSGGSIAIVSFKSKKVLLRLDNEKPHLCDLSVSFDGTLLAFNSRSEIRFVNLKTMKELPSLEVASSTCCIHPNNETIATAYNGNISLWDIHSRMKIATMYRHKYGFIKMCFSPDGATLVTGSGDQSIVLWNVPSDLPCLPKTQRNMFVSCSCFSPDGKLFVVGGAGLHLFDVNTWSKRLTLMNTGHSIDDAYFICDGSLLVVVLGERAMVWCMKTLEIVKTYDEEHVSSFSPHDNTIAMISPSAEAVSILSTVTGERVQYIEDKRKYGRILQTSFTSQGGKIAVARGTDHSYCYIYLFDIKTGQNVQFLFADFRAQKLRLRFSPNGKFLAVTQGQDSCIKLWCLDTSSEILLGTKFLSGGCCFSNDSTLLAYGSGNEVVVFNISERQTIAKLKGHACNITNVCFHPEGKLLASCSSDDAIYVWDLHETELTHVIGVPRSLTVDSDMALANLDEKFKTLVQSLTNQRADI